MRFGCNHFAGWTRFCKIQDGDTGLSQEKEDADAQWFVLEPLVVCVVMNSCHELYACQIHACRKSMNGDQYTCAYV